MQYFGLQIIIHSTAEAIKKQTAKVLIGSSKQKRITASSSTAKYQQRKQQSQQNKSQTKRIDGFRNNNNGCIKKKTSLPAKTKKKSSFHLPRINGSSIKTTSSASPSTLKIFSDSNNKPYYR